MIIGNNSKFFIQTDIFYVANGFAMGTFNFWIDGIMYPRKATDITLGVLLHQIIGSFEYALKFKYKETNLPITEIDFFKEELEEINLCYGTVDHLFDYDFSFFYEIVGDKIRFLYSQDGGGFNEIRICKNYFESMIPILKKQLNSMRKLLNNKSIDQAIWYKFVDREKNRVDTYRTRNNGNDWEWYLNVPKFIPQVENES